MRNIRYQQALENAEGQALANDADFRPAPLPTIPEQVLRRHGARVLDPVNAPHADGEPAPNPTIYRTGVLLFPSDVLQDEALMRQIGVALVTVGMRIAEQEREQEQYREQENVWGGYSEDARPMLLRPADGASVVVDAWVALQAIRGGVDPGQVDRIALDHLLITASYTDGRSGIGGEPATDGNGVPELRRSGGNGGYGGRVPLAFAGSVPSRGGPPADGRRALVLIPDSGYGEHPDLQRDDVVNDGFINVEPQLQNDIVDSGLQTVTAIDPAGQQAVIDPAAKQTLEELRNVEDGSPIAQPLVGDLYPYTGHGTFCAGLVRQIAPEARVKAVRVMTGDGLVKESALLAVLKRLSDRMRGGGEVVDVISLSCGYFEERQLDPELTTKLNEHLDELRDLGTVVVAAAGNYASTTPFFPAALAGEDDAAERAPMLAVGALNPEGTVAIFSNYNSWVEWFADGAMLVSTLPTNLNGSYGADIRVEAGAVFGSPARASLDRDNFSSGWGLWHGTSFAAPIVAAEVAKRLMAAGTLQQPQNTHEAAQRAKDAVQRAQMVVNEMKDEFGA
ncbi:S8 family peptidase [Planobispora takensis]|uniref:Peptidase S8 n=1 Tax=Planobispora takensis TaxID=1367882 RepID=A0A8J3WTN8_9ACTN|nr:S8/S53 family peptidase [Planobispora takensis]GII02064.1 peptidase S8 [Planobispora takensis]